MLEGFQAKFLSGIDPSDILLDNAMPTEILQVISFYVKYVLHLHPSFGVWECSGSRFREGCAATLALNQGIDLEKGANALQDGISCIHQHTDNLRRATEYLVQLCDVRCRDNLSIINIKWLTFYNRGTPDPRIGDFIRSLEELRAHESCGFLTPMFPF